MSESSREWELANDIKELAGKVSKMEAKMEPLEEGVANFRKHQTRASTFFDRAEAKMDMEEEAEKKASEKHKNRQFKLGICAIFLVPLLSFCTYRSYVLLNDMFRIVDEWHTTHKDVPQTKTEPCGVQKSQQSLELAAGLSVGVR